MQLRIFNVAAKPACITMKISSFKAGKSEQRFKYKSFEPNVVNVPWQIDHAELNLSLSRANIKLGELNTVS